MYDTMFMRSLSGYALINSKRRVYFSLPSSEAVKEPHFLDFLLCKINNLQVKNCWFWEFFYSISTW